MKSSRDTDLQIALERLSSTKVNFAAKVQLLIDQLDGNNLLLRLTV
jgi:hypothetical protein